MRANRRPQRHLFGWLPAVALAFSLTGPARGQPPALDQRTALIVLDLQNSILSRPTVDPIDGIIARAGRLIDAFHRRGLPVILVNAVAQPPGRIDQVHRTEAQPARNRSELIAALPRAAGDHLISKRSWSAFSQTDLSRYLRRRGVTQIVILGYSASGAVESTAREGYDLGFNVTLARDAITDSNGEALANAMTRVFPRIGHLESTEEIVRQLGARDH